MVLNIVLTILTMRYVRVSWTPVTGTFDLRQYSVILCNNTLCYYISTNDTSVNVNVTVFGSDTIFAQVFAESQCGDVGNPGRSNVIFCKCKMIFLSL